MKNRTTHYHIKIEKHILFMATVLGILVAGLVLTLTQVGQAQTIQQRAQMMAVDTANPASVAHPELNGACPIGGGLPPVPCAANYTCQISTTTNVGGCVANSTQGAAGPSNPNNCAPANSTAPGQVCDIKAGYTCQNGFCVNSAPGIPSSSSATANGQQTGPAATTISGSAGGTSPNPGAVCNGTTTLNPDEIRVLNGLCPVIDPNPAKNFCQDFCDRVNGNSDKCKPGKAGIYYCGNLNSTCKPGSDPKTVCGSTQPGQGYCAKTEGVCCKNPPPPPPPPPAPAPGNNPAAPRPAPPGGAAPAGAVANCQKTCKKPNLCNSKGICYTPAANGGGGGGGGGTANACKTLNQACGPNSVCRYFGSGGINSPTLSCQQGGQQVTQIAPNGGSTQVLTNQLGPGAACRNGTECKSGNCAPAGGTSFTCQ